MRTSLSALVLLFVSHAVLAEQPLPRQVRDSVVRIVYQQSEHACLGTGTFVGHDEGLGLVVTCAHLFTEGVGEPFIIGPNGLQRAHLVAIDEKNDLACLLVVSKTTAAVAVAAERPRRGTTLTWCGYGEVGDFVAMRGTLEEYATLQGGKANGVLEVTGAARHGDSGGPIFNARGELVAVIMGTDGSLVDGTHGAIIRDFLAQHPVTEELRAKMLARQSHPVPDRLHALARLSEEAGDIIKASE
ncbi:MAG: trypsin-like peptidase domain-containing protein [Pirellulales bacterium]|nr:trypsin-like peptidase domain-containing protein [Pirellulales bacterium]